MNTKTNLKDSSEHLIIKDMNYSSALIMIDKRSYLEVADTPRHRYAKNLREYFKHFPDRQNIENILDTIVPFNSNADQWKILDRFFEWLDSRSFQLETCPHDLLDEDRVQYLQSDEDRRVYEISIDEDGRFHHAGTDRPVDTAQKTWLFVLKENRMFAAEKKTTSPRFHHSSFFSGQPVNAAGLIICSNGTLKRLFPHSGHYRPQDHHFCSLLKFLRDRKVNLDNLEVDAQRVYKVGRILEGDGTKLKKQDSKLMMSGQTIYDFLCLKNHVTNYVGLFKELLSLSEAHVRLPTIETDGRTEGEDGEEGYILEGQKDGLFSPSIISAHCRMERIAAIHKENSPLSKISQFRTTRGIGHADEGELEERDDDTCDGTELLDHSSVCLSSPLFASIRLTDRSYSLDEIHSIDLSNGEEGLLKGPLREDRRTEASVLEP